MSPVTDHLWLATSADLRRVRELGQEALVAALGRLVDDEEEWFVAWFDAEEEDWEADEVFDWQITDVAVFGCTVAYVELSVALVVYSMVDEEAPIITMSIPAVVRLLLGPPLTADSLELEFLTLRDCVAADRVADPLGLLSGDDGLRAEVDEYLERSARIRDPSRPTVFVQETDRGIEVYGLPGPDEPQAPESRSDSQ
ncbi:MAG: hypothetical protein H0W36_10705 [Gemmatimonadetes bacterium]|nr:hypothetical protein [Gemmatimonadota bacterium]